LLISPSPKAPDWSRLPGRNGNCSRRHWISDFGGLRLPTQSKRAELTMCWKR
jgi:hypothetical protein